MSIVLNKIVNFKIAKKLKAIYVVKAKSLDDILVGGINQLHFSPKQLLWTALSLKN